MTYGLSEQAIAKVHQVLAHHPQVERAILFGSRAKGCQKPGSDIDLSFVGTLDRRQLGRIADELDDLLLPYEFSLSIYNRITDPDFLAHVNRVGITFYNRSPAEAAR